MVEWIIRFIKGAFIGSGFILPGISGGALAAVFGVYERIISFLANIKQNFRENVIYIIPIALGAAAGVFLLSFAASFLLGEYEVQMLWLFIGCIIGTLPALWRHAGEKGRDRKHIFIVIIAFVLSLIFLVYGEHLFKGDISPGFLTWMLSGGLIGLGLIIPGLSPSNFLLYMGVYEDMLAGIKEIDFMVIIPVLIGAVLIVISLSKLIDYALHRMYAGIFHCMIGIVLSSTIMIIPTDFNYLSLGGVTCLLLFCAGIGVGYFMSALEKKYKHA